MKASTLLTSSLILLTSFLLGCATTDQYDIRPDEGNDGIPTAVDWQNQNDAKLAAATQPDVLAKFVASDAAADALLAQLKGAYATDAVVMTQIGCVTQFTLCPKQAAARKVWVAALERKMSSSKDDYVRTFCQQQLWLCK